MNALASLAKACLAKGQAYLGDGNVDAAAEEFARILNDGSEGMDKINALYGYAECYRQRGQWEEALTHYRAVLCEFPLHDGALHRIQEIEGMKVEREEQQGQREDGAADMKRGDAAAAMKRGDATKRGDGAATKWGDGAAATKRARTTF